MTLEEAASSTVDNVIDRGREAAEKAGQTVKESYETAQQYVQGMGLDFGLRDFVRREPWLAITAAFAIGYVTAQIVKRHS